MTTELERAVKLTTPFAYGVKEKQAPRYPAMRTPYADGDTLTASDGFRIARYAPVDTTGHANTPGAFPDCAGYAELLAGHSYPWAITWTCEEFWKLTGDLLAEYRTAKSGLRKWEQGRVDTSARLYDSGTLTRTFMPGDTPRVSLSVEYLRDLARVTRKGSITIDVHPESLALKAFTPRKPVRVTWSDVPKLTVLLMPTITTWAEGETLQTY